MAALFMFVESHIALAQSSPQALQQLLDTNPSLVLIEVNQQLEQLSTSSQNRHEIFEFRLVQIEAMLKLGRYKSASQTIAGLESQVSEMENRDLEIQLFLLKADSLLRTNKTNLAKKQLEKARELHTTNPLLLADIYDGLSEAFRAQANYLEAKKFIERAITLVKKEEDKRRLANYYNKLGIIYEYIGSLDDALSAHETSLKTQTELNSQQGISNSLYNIAELYRDLENLEQSLNYFNQALQIDLSLGDPRHISNSYSKIGQVLLQQGNYSQAKININKAIKLTREMQANSKTAWQLSILSNIELAQNNYERALVHANEALSLVQGSDDNRTIRSVRLSLANIFIAKGELASAKTQLLLILQNAQVGIQIKSEAHQKLSVIEYEQGNYREALVNLQKYQSLQDELRKEDDEQKSMQMKINVEIIKKEHALTLLQKAQNLQQIQLENLELQRELAITVALLILALMVIYFLRKRQEEKFKALKQRMAQESLEQKNKLLADISHDLRTPLTSLSLMVEALIFQVEPDPSVTYKKIERKIGELDNLITDIYQSAKFDKNTMSMHFQQVEICSLIESVCSELTALFENKEQKLALSTSHAHIPVLADPNRLKQAVLNLIRNSHFYTDKGGQCNILVKQESSQIKITIEDSFPGVKESELSLIFERNFRGDKAKNKDEDGSGLGLAICKEIIIAHEGHIHAMHSSLGGVLIEINLPLFCEGNT